MDTQNPSDNLKPQFGASRRQRSKGDAEQPDAVTFANHFRAAPEYGEYRRSVRNTARFSGVLALVPSLFIIVGGMVDNTELGTVVFSLFFVLAACGSVFILSNFIDKQKFEKLFRDRVIVHRFSELQGEESALASASLNGRLDLASLWATTQKRIDVYHGIATSQAQATFKVAQIASIAGFVAVLAMGCLAAFATSGTASIAAAVVGVAGAAMGAYIGATFMRAQAEASAQLRQFFLQPVEFSRILGAERLIDSLPEGERSDAVLQVVQTMMPSDLRDKAES